MSDERVLVLDASVGLKWFKPEPGQDEALAVLSATLLDGVRVLAPVHFGHEVLAVVARHWGPMHVEAAWEMITGSGVVLVPLGGEIVAEAAAQCEALGCSFYDALAPALATLLDATLVSADARAHASYPGVQLVGLRG